MHPIVFIVDDDEAVRIGLLRLFSSVDMEARAFETGREFLDQYDEKQVGCLITDMRMPSMSGFDVQKEIKGRNLNLPLLFVSGHGDLENAVRAMKAGAMDFIQKPFNDEYLIEATQKALEKSIACAQTMKEHNKTKALMNTLTHREREVFDELSVGHLNKVIAAKMGLSEKTIEFHRTNLMKKLGVRSMAQLIMMKAVETESQSWRS